MPKQKKKRKPKSMRGKKGREKTDAESSGALSEALDILNMSQEKDVEEEKE